ncbi:MAG: hypothetical protein Kilf2KO_44470 [Rhodospirillales bacterium]
MPFEVEAPEILGPTQFLEDEPQADDPSFLDTLGAAFRIENTVGSLLADETLVGGGDPVPGFDAFEGFGEDDWGRYQPILPALATAESPSEAAAIKRQFEREQQDRQTLDDAGLTGTLLSIGAAIFDPVTFVPVGGVATKVARGSSGVLRGAAAAGTAGAVSTAAQEAALQSTQVSRPLSESLLNVGAGTLLSGLIGGGAVALFGRQSGNVSPVETALVEPTVRAGDEGFEPTVRSDEDSFSPTVRSDEDSFAPTVRSDEESFAPTVRSDEESFAPTVRADEGLDEAANAVRSDIAAADRIARGEQDPAVASRQPSAEAGSRQAELEASYRQYLGDPQGAPTGREFVDGEVYPLMDLPRFVARYLDGRQPGTLTPEVKFELGDLHPASRESAAKLVPEFAQVRPVVAVSNRALAHASTVRGDDFEKLLEALPRLIAQQAEVINNRRVFGVTLARRISIGDEKVGGRTKHNVATVEAVQSADGIEVVQFQVMREKSLQSRRRQAAREKDVGGGGGPPSRRIGDAGAAPHAEADNPDVPPTDIKVAPLPDSVKTSDLPEIELPKPSGSGGSVGAMAVDRATLREDTLRTAAKLEKALRFQDPLLRTLHSPSKTVRNVVQELVEGALEFRKNELGIPTARGGAAETRAKMWEAPLAASIIEMDRLFVRHRFGRQVAFGRQKAAAADLRGAAERQGKLTYDEFKGEVGRAMRRDDLHVVPEVQQAAQHFRKTLYDPLKDRSIAAGLIPEGVEVTTAASYLSRVYNTPKIRARRPQFVEILTRWLARANPDEDVLELERVADQITDRILGTPDGRIPYEPMGDIEIPGLGGHDEARGARGAAKSRLLDIPDAFVEEFLENDIEYLARAYTRTLGSDAEIAIKFGDPMMTRATQDINADYAKLIARAEQTSVEKGWSAARLEKELKRLGERKDKDLRDIQGMRERIQGKFAPPRDPEGIFATSGRVLRHWNYLRYMGSVVVSSIPDLGRPVMVHGMSAFTHGYVPLIRSLRSARLAGEEVKRAGTALDMVLDSRAMAMADILDDYGRGGKFERALRSASSRFGLMSLMSPWNSAMRQFTGMVAMGRALKAADAWASGKVSKKEMRALAASGIDLELAQRISRQARQYGKTEGGLRLPETAAWDDREAAAALRAAIVRDVDRTIIMPGQEKPLWMSTEMGKVIGQFRSFAVASVQKTLLAGLQQRDAAALSGLVLMMGLGALRYALLLWGTSQVMPEDWKKWAVEAFDRAGVAGWLMEAHNSLAKVSGGAIGVSALTDTPPASRYAARNAVDALVGPSFGTVHDAVDALRATTTGEWSSRDVHSARRLLPMQNVFYLRGLFDSLERGLAEQAGTLPRERIAR